MELETINKLYLELSQITTATTAREILLQKQLAEAQKAEQEDAAYQARRSDQGLMESEWGPMEDAPPHEDPPMHVAVVEGDDAVRTLQWNRDVAAFAYPVGTLLYAAHPAAPVAQGDAEDAARYRFLAGHCRSTSEHWGGRWSIIVDGPAPKSHDSEDDFDAAIDAARSQAKEGA